MQKANFIQYPFLNNGVIPEYIESTEEYVEKIGKPINNFIAKHEQDTLLHWEWLNWRGVIPRFDKYALEIKILEPQENTLLS